MILKQHYPLFQTFFGTPSLKQRAARNGRSAEMEHRAILREVLLVLKKRSLAEVLAAMPNVGTDADFERIQGKQQVADVFA
ncbi:MAG: DNA-binding protein [Thiothrix lacustris]|uniref:DNA-binding protein n=1 Tax=Thiothrix lacustris TaxID=525917 RepID=A0A1Y1QCH0_9GAMM|nr:MAG: DNA-binding protein [Thiothrix lacustris]